MATVTRTLDPTQALAIRRRILSDTYGSALEKLAEAVTDGVLDRDDAVPDIVDAKKPLPEIEALLDVFGWEVRPGEVTLTVDEDDLHDWAVSAFALARESIGERWANRSEGEKIALDRQWLAEAEAVLPLIESLEQRSELELA